ncbi:MAG: HIT domain-containing protein [Planctomycetales bacterium]|nr:HIT domain-containing protein [Planctomycetales bacterium]
MDEQRLWAPWRLSYIKGQDEPEPGPDPQSWQAGAEPSCFLCRCSARYTDQREADRRNLVVRHTDHAVVVLNRYPYSNGHLLIAPTRHEGDLCNLDQQDHLELMGLIAEMKQALEQELNAFGFNIGLNLGQAAGAGLPGHLHWHLVPRWPGDHNFMSVTAGARVIPQALDELWNLLREA